jgi:hypothetical protein
MERARFDALLAQHGETMTLARATAIDTWSPVTLKGKIYGAGGRELVGGQQQQLRQVKIGNSEIAAAAWPGPPRKGDRLTDAAGRVYSVQEVDTRSDAGEVWAHFMAVLG